MSLIICVDDPGAGSLGQTLRPAQNEGGGGAGEGRRGGARGRGPGALRLPTTPALISGCRGRAASLADSDAGRGGVATERRSRAAADPGRRGHRPGLAKLL